MKPIPLLLAAVLLAPAAQAQDRWSIGVGLGAPYSGLGANLSLVSDRSFRYLSLGCPAAGSSKTDDGFDSEVACGAGLGWLRTDWFGNAATRHGLGLYVGAVGGERDDADDKLTAVYGFGLSYMYFFRNASEPGFHLGVTPAIGFHDGEVDAHGLFGFGYQF